MKNTHFLDKLFSPVKGNRASKGGNVDFYDMFEGDCGETQADGVDGIDGIDGIVGSANQAYKSDASCTNIRQQEYIAHRRKRREWLDQFMVRGGSKYTHESRHKHAMSRMRAPSGRFLTKSESRDISK